MRVFLAGASGVIGKRMIPQLLAQGHYVIGMMHNPKNAETVHQLGAEPVVVDGLKREAVIEAVAQAQPEAIIHQMSAIKSLNNPRNFDKAFEETNKLRTVGTDNLLDGARAAGTTRFIVQSYGGWNYERTGSRIKTEEDSLDPKPPRKQRKSLNAIRYLENAVLNLEGIEAVALRYGYIYGPGTGFPPASLGRKSAPLPIVGDGAGIWSFVHLEDAASAAVAALDAAPGIYNIVDDDPAPISEWVPQLARMLGTKKPRHMPAWLGRLLLGEVGISLMTKVRGASNEKAKTVMGWKPQYPTWREGFIG